jgi:DNA-binding phage protein
MGRRPGLSSTELAFRQAFASALRQVIGNDRGAASRAASELLISRQAISLYLKEKATPSAEIIRRVCKRWSLTLDVRGNIVSDASFAMPRQGPVEAAAIQLPLITDALQALKDEDVKVKITRKIGDSLGIEVKIDFGT